MFGAHVDIQLVISVEEGILDAEDAEDTAIVAGLGDAVVLKTNPGVNHLCCGGWGGLTHRGMSSLEDDTLILPHILLLVAVTFIIDISRR